MKAFVFPTINLSATGMNIQRLRKSRGLSVKDLQEFFGFEAPQAIYKWQSGASLPSVDNLLALSQILEVPMERILVKKTAHCLPVHLSGPKNKRVPAFTAAFSPAH